MENDQVLEAEARLYRPQSSSPPPYHQQHQEHLGQDAVKVAYGGVDILEDEDTPLLSRDPDARRDIGRATTPEDPDDRPPPTWSGERDFDGLPWWKTPSVRAESTRLRNMILILIQQVLWLIPPYLIYTLAFGAIVVPKLNLIVSLVCQQYLSDRAIHDPHFQFMPVNFGAENPQCRVPKVQSMVSKFTLYGNLIGGILSAVTSPKLGALSDRYGRSKILAMTSIGFFLGEIITIIAATYPEMFPVQWMLLGYATDGLCGSFITGMAISNAYASDCTPPSKRSVTFAYLHSCFFTGIAIGPVIGGFIVKATGQLVSVFYVALGAHLLFLCCLVFVIPESLTKERQMIAREKHKVIHEVSTRMNWATPLKTISTLGGLLTPLSILWPTGEGSNSAVRRNLISLAAVDTVMFGVAMGSMTIITIYSGYQFGWGTFQSSIFMSISSTCRVTVLLVVLPTIVRLVRGRTDYAQQRQSGSDKLDLAIIRTAVLFDMAGYIGYATVRTGTLLIVCGAVAAVGGMGSPTLQSALTKHVPPDRTGQLLGAVGLLHALARIVAPTVFNLIYALTVGKFTQTVFVCLAACFGLAFLLSLFIRPHGKSSPWLRRYGITNGRCSVLG